MKNIFIVLGLVWATIGFAQEAELGDENQPPVLEDIPNYTINELETLEFQGVATDVDGPRPTPLFSMNTNVAGASMTDNGFFSWTPTAEQGPGEYGFVVIVSDGRNGQDSDTFTVTVLEKGDPMENTLELCSDERDNDEDKYTDMEDEDCAEFMPTLTVIKKVEGGGVKTSADFTINVTGTEANPPSFPGSETGVVVTMMPGVYSVSETGFDGYLQAMSFDCFEETTLAVGEHKVCTIINRYQNENGDDDDDDEQPPAPEPQPQPEPERSSSGGGRSGRSRAPQGQVLGASTTCAPYLTGYLRFGADNPQDQVTKLQSFLNEYLGLNLPLTGFFGSLTEAAVNQFQLSQKVTVLRPWLAYGLPSEDTATGYVYKTTLTQINNLVCPGLALATPQLP